MTRTLAVLGARNLGGAIIDHFIGLGWNVGGVARSDDTVQRVRERGAHAVGADAAEPAALHQALHEIREHFGSLDAVVNAVSASRAAGGPFGGGDLADADLERFNAWTVAVAEQAFVFLSEGMKALQQTGRGTLVQITGGSSRRAMPGKGLWAAGAFATRALVQAAAQEQRSSGIHVALLAVDATIESPKTAAFTADQPREALADMGAIAEAVAFLVAQGPRALTHELVVTPAGDRWVP
ncbi:MAG TPA: SDR family oxidoreductase [Solirubrobacteraceae bacterium]|nr:SDR family oxidoreductase [Solirubrobacteraceae bacterium]